jgi:hypothetical protein
MISLVSIYNEVTFKQKPLIGSGTQHVVYQSKHNPNIVYKIGEKNETLKWVTLFKKYPKYFPIIYKTGLTNSKKDGKIITDMYVAIEKLNTEQAIYEWELMENELSKLQIIDIDFIHAFDDTMKVAIVDEEYNNQILESLKAHNKKIYYLYIKWVNFLHTINSIVQPLKNGTMLDVHRYNYGYTNEGKIKCLDI